MTTAPFTPKDPDGVAQWRKVYDLLTPDALPVDEVVTHEALCAALDLAYPAGRREAQGVFRAAAARILVDFDEAFMPIRNIGYRKVRAAEHLKLADSARRRAHRAIRRGLAVVQHVKVDELTQIERSRRDFVEVVLESHSATLRAHGRAIADVTHAQRRTEVEVTRAHLKLDAVLKALRAQGFHVDSPVDTVIDAEPPFEPEVAS